MEIAVNATVSPDSTVEEEGSISTSYCDADIVEVVVDITFTQASTILLQAVPGGQIAGDPGSHTPSAQLSFPLQ